MVGRDDAAARRRPDDWAGPDDELGRYITDTSRRTLASYREQPDLVAEHAAVEEDTAHGGYRHRQLVELIQNSADALAPTSEEGETDDQRSPDRDGRIEIRLTESSLYCADDGEPIDQAGMRALMFSHLSPRRGTGQIGTFGLGFKAVLGVTDSPEFFSRSGSFRFDRMESSRRVREVVPDAEKCPVLRLAEPVDPVEFRESDGVLGDLMGWATNIVRLPLRRGARDDIREQLVNFPAEFLLFVAHVGKLVLTDGSPTLNRRLELEKVDDDHLLADGDAITQWRVFEHEHLLTIDARADRRPGDETDEVRIWWAAPLDRLDRPGRFWAFFPTVTPSLVPGILNAPWKTNEDRQNLLPGTYNDELIGAAAMLIADGLPQLATADDPARHLEALPRRREAGDTDQAARLRRDLFDTVHDRAILPDQDGELCFTDELHYPPLKLTSGGQVCTAALNKWSSCPGRPVDWLHHSAWSRKRLATVDRLFNPEGETLHWSEGAPRADLAEWMEALVNDAELHDAAEASMAAIQTAALIPRDRRTDADLGRIVLTATGGWRRPDPDRLFLPVESPALGSTMDLESCVHPDLASDSQTAEALRELGIESPSPESRFRLVAERVLAHRSVGTGRNDIQESFWVLSRELSCTVAREIIEGHAGWQNGMRVRTRAGDWQPLYSVLMPGDIVPEEGSRDDAVTVDTVFHGRDEELLRTLGATDAPVDGYDVLCEPCFTRYRDRSESEYREQDLPANPWAGYLDFTHYEGVGPLTVLIGLSEEGRALYTDALLRLEACYRLWVMWHTGSNQGTYPQMPCESLVLHLLRTYGRVRTPSGIVPLADALGPQPASPAALHALLQHPRADRIKDAFDLSDPVPEFVGEGDPIPLTDIWPGLVEHLPAHRRTCRVVLCERIRVADRERPCVFHRDDVHLVGSVDDDEHHALELIADELGLGLADRQIEAILQRRTSTEIEARRAAVRQCDKDAERLLAAVGEQALRQGLPRSLLDVLESGGESLSGVDVAEAAIATYHTDALRQFRWALEDLGPPTGWSGSARAVAFVRSLGFTEEWAGERQRRRDPFLEVDGPLALPSLHDYQRIVAHNVRGMLGSQSGHGAERRGMLSMPTGSGKTRVAVQAIVEAIRDDGLRGGVLWVADRDELCEQAVEAWQQVWRSIGAEAGRLRISRLWGGQGRPQPMSERHVVVATVQTLSSRLSNRPVEYEFLKDFELAVFDEAHRSIAPTFTSVMAEIGLTYRRTTDEPFLIGLTATPYRGHDEVETRRLANRYGGNRLDAGAFGSNDPQDVFQQLQDMGVLARADHGLIEGETLRLGPEQLAEIDRFTRGSERPEHLLAWLPQSVEDYIAGSSRRTTRIIEAYETHVESDWPTLVFATSVEHAQTLAALLNRKGIPARSVSGTTEPVTRRRVVERFRNGEIKALVNYGVFGEGFDAPRTRAIIVARPVYSPNLYFQMIGRGLRGPLNGGDERCLILNVRDNIQNFGARLAFDELDWLWDR